MWLVADIGLNYFKTVLFQLTSGSLVFNIQSVLGSTPKIAIIP
jgi:hypothetical protein